MEIANPTGDTITLSYDSIPYTFEPKSVLSLSDEAGRFLAATGKRFGLVPVHFGADVSQIRLAGLRARLFYYRRILAEHELTNALQVEKKFPPIQDSDAVRQAKLAEPIYAQAVAKLEEKLGVEADREYKRDLAEVLEDAALQVPALAEGTIDDLRNEYERVAGVSPSMAWNGKTLRARIRDAQAEAEQRRTVKTSARNSAGPSGSATEPGPAPGMAPDDLLSGPLTRSLG